MAPVVRAIRTYGQAIGDPKTIVEDVPPIVHDRQCDDARAQIVDDPLTVLLGDTAAQSIHLEAVVRKVVVHVGIAQYP